MSKKHKLHRASAQRQIQQPQPAVAPKPHQLRGLARREWIDRVAKEMFQAEMGHDIDQFIRSTQLTTQAFESQMLESKGGPEGWGPDISVYENRMNEGLAIRLLREKRTWLRDCRQRIEKALADEAAAEAEQADQGRDGKGAVEVEAPATDQQPAEKHQAIDTATSAPDASPGHQHAIEVQELAHAT